MSTIKQMEKMMKQHFYQISEEQKKAILQSPESLKHYMFEYINQKDSNVIIDFIEEFFHYDVMDETEYGVTKDEAFLEAYRQFMEDEIYKTDSVDVVDDMVEELYSRLICSIH